MKFLSALGGNNFIFLVDYIVGGDIKVPSLVWVSFLAGNVISMVIVFLWLPLIIINLAPSYYTPEDVFKDRVKRLQEQYSNQNLLTEDDSDAGVKRLQTQSSRQNLITADDSDAGLKRLTTQSSRQDLLAEEDSDRYEQKSLKFSAWQNGNEISI